MWLKQLFLDTAIDFEKRCKTRIVVSIIMLLLGLLTILLAVFTESGPEDFTGGFYTGSGAGLMGAGICTIIINYRYLKNPELKKKRAILESDERNRLLGLRTWAFAGYSMFLALYIGIVISGLFSVTVMRTLLVVGACYGVLLLLIRTILQKTM